MRFFKATWRFAAGIGIGILMPALALAGPLRDAKSTGEVFAGGASDPYTLAVRATVWGYPLVRAAELREKATTPDVPPTPEVAFAPINTLGHARALASPETRIGVAPNNDTLYTLAFLDTNSGPFKLSTPDFGNRYYVFQFGEADSSTRQFYGQSTHGRRLPPIFIVGPEYRGTPPVGALLVRSTQRYLMIAGRILVDGPGDLAAVHALQDQIVLHKGPEVRREAGGVRRVSAPPARPDTPVPANLGLLAKLGEVLRDWRPDKEERRLLSSWRAIGLDTQRGFRAGRLSDTERALVERGVEDGLAIIRAKTRHLGLPANGWSTSYAGSRFGSDYLLRAAVAMDQIYVLDRKEALYPVAHVDANGAELDGRKRYVICFRTRDLPPVDAFWSITLYYAKGFLVPNAIDRYSIGDRTPGISYGADGSLHVYVQHDRPDSARSANWLPAPEEPFMLMMRLYGPKESAINGQWHPPAIMPVPAGSEQAPYKAPAQDH